MCGIAYDTRRDSVVTYVASRSCCTLGLFPTLDPHKSTCTTRYQSSNKKGLITELKISYRTQTCPVDRYNIDNDNNNNNK